MYSRNSFGSYYPVESMIHKLNPVIKIINFVNTTNCEFYYIRINNTTGQIKISINNSKIREKWTIYKRKQIKIIVYFL